MDEPSQSPTFRDVDADDDVARLIAMMDATDSWPAVQAARSWVIDRAGSPVRTLDVGSGPGTFSSMLVTASSGPAGFFVDVDRSRSMALAARRRRAAACVVVADGVALPLADGAVDLVHAERVLQWVADPEQALSELWRTVSTGGSLAVTDTDWSTFSVDHPDPDAAARLATAAQAWVPWSTFARTVARRLGDLGATEVAVRADAVAVTAWDADDPAEGDGPPGLPLRTIAAAGPEGCADDVDVLARLARSGHFFATLTLVTTLARR